MARKRKRSESRFGFGHLVGAVGAFVLAAGVGSPWLKVDGDSLFSHALTAKGIRPELATTILTNYASPADRVWGTPASERVAQALGIGETGLAQNVYVGGAVLALALLALFVVVGSVLAPTAYRARRPAPLLALAAIGGLAACAATLWLLSPDPHSSMRPTTGMWLVLGGSGALFLASLTLGSNRRGVAYDEPELSKPAKQFENTDHLAYSHGAWVPRSSEDRH